MQLFIVFHVAEKTIQKINYKTDSFKYRNRKIIKNIKIRISKLVDN